MYSGPVPMGIYSASLSAVKLLSECVVLVPNFLLSAAFCDSYLLQLLL